MAKDDEKADDLIPGALKKSASYHSDYGNKTYGQLKKLASSKPPDKKARQMKKLIEQQSRLKQKLKGRKR